MEYTRIDSDADGETHFGSGEIDLSMTNSAPPATPFYVSLPMAAKQFVFATLLPG